MIRFFEKYPTWIIACLFSISFFSSCSSDNEEDLFADEEPPAFISFSENIVPLLTTKCYGCHSGEAQLGSGIKLDNYADLKVRVDDGSFLGALKHEGYTPMPPTGVMLPASEIADIEQWIAEGALDN